MEAFYIQVIKPNKEVVYTILTDREISYWRSKGYIVIVLDDVNMFDRLRFGRIVK